MGTSGAPSLTTVPTPGPSRVPLINTLFPPSVNPTALLPQPSLLHLHVLSWPFQDKTRFRMKPTVPSLHAAAGLRGTRGLTKHDGAAREPWDASDTYPGVPMLSTGSPTPTGVGGGREVGWMRSEPASQRGSNRVKLLSSRPEGGRRFFACSAPYVSLLVVSALQKTSRIQPSDLSLGFIPLPSPMTPSKNSKTYYALTACRGSFLSSGHSPSSSPSLSADPFTVFLLPAQPSVSQMTRSPPTVTGGV